MARKHYSTEQIIGMLREAEVRLSQGQTIGAICKSLGISEQSYYRWRRDYGGLKLDQAKRLKELERENERLRKAVSELTLDKLILIGELLRENTEPLAPPRLCRACALQSRCLGAPGLRRGRPASLDAAPTSGCP
jgi:transposase-like protein